MYTNYLTHALNAAYTRQCRYELRILCKEQVSFQTDAVMADASRCAKKETVLIHLATHGMLCTPPLQILPDQVKSVDADAAMENAALVLTKSRPARGAKDDKPQLEATRNYGLAIVHSLLAVLPYQDFSVYIPSALEFLTPGQKKVMAPAQQQWFYWDGQSPGHTSRWALCDELRRVSAAIQTTLRKRPPFQTG